METLRIAVAALRTHKLRSFLTLLGVIIGVMTVISVISIIAGLNSYIAERVFDLNPDVFIATQFGIITSREDFLEAVKRKPIDERDLRAIELHCSRCGMVGSALQSRMPVKYGNQRMTDVRVSGTSANMVVLNNIDLQEGRFFTETEQGHSALVAVIGAGLQEELFGKLDPIGRRISLNGHPLKVIGLMKKQGTVLGQNQDNQLFIPITTFEKTFGSRRSIDVFIRSAGGLADMDAAQDEVRTILRARRHTSFGAKDPFAFVTAEAIQKVWKSISAGAFALMLFISGISLVVGGIVITNIMLVSVIERTREIGIRRAMGARSRDIKLQFLVEAILLSLFGGVIGVALGFSIARVIAWASPLPTLVRPIHVLAALLVALVTGVVSGYFPARKAASLVPVEALRFES